MDSFDSANLLSGGSRLLSQSPQFSFNNNSSGSSTLELEPQTQTQTRHHHNPKTKSRTRPSIAQALGFGAPVDQSADDLSVLGALEEEDAGEEMEGRKEKLQSDLFVLRQLNGAFAVYNDALREAQGRLAEQLEQTDALLNKYINILSKSDKVTRLIFDERWMGAEADEAQLEEEEREREEKRLREEEERLERAMREEMERLQREKRDRAPARSSSGVRGVRGTRASVRAGAAARGGSRTGSISGSAVGPSKIARPSSVAVSSARGTTSIPRGVSKRSS
ncbi:hypothetical protein BGY98DRAFT_985076 [Russula aff. rugulosa BPL654]|nr:hypothetical protein BGY98DRAFT_985076 [Russula aff. rugulosa BPL654]